MLYPDHAPLSLLKKSDFAVSDSFNQLQRILQVAPNLFGGMSIGTQGNWDIVTVQYLEHGQGWIDFPGRIS